MSTARVDVVLVDLRPTLAAPGDELPARRRSAAARAVLLAELGVDEAQLESTDDGKPVLTDGSRHFNVSHSHDLAAIALAGVEVGIDVEALGGRRRRVLPGVLAETERERVLSAPDPVLAFLRAWTRKEALLKAIGCGLRVRLKDVAIDEDHDHLRVAALPPQLGDPAPWAVADLALDGAVGAVAARADALAISLR